MVEVEIRAPVFDEESGEVVWHARAFVRADGAELGIYGDDPRVIDPQLPVVSVATGRSVRGNDDPEEWARNLPHAYRAGDLVAVVVLDEAEQTQRVAPAEGASPPVIPEPPALRVPNNAEPVR